METIKLETQNVKIKQSEVLFDEFKVEYSIKYTKPNEIVVAGASSEEILSLLTVMGTKTP